MFTISKSQKLLDDAHEKMEIIEMSIELITQFVSDDGD